MKAHDFAKRAGELLTDRGVDRDQPNGERSMARCVSAFNSMTGHNLSTEDGWLFMVYLKHARMRGGSYRMDDYEDAVSYEALMAEEAAPNELPETPEDIVWSQVDGMYVSRADIALFEEQADGNNQPKK